MIVAAAGNEHLRIGAGGQVLSHGPLTAPGPTRSSTTSACTRSPVASPASSTCPRPATSSTAPSASCAAGTIGDPTNVDATASRRPTRTSRPGSGRRTSSPTTATTGPRIDIAGPGGARKFNLPDCDRGGTRGFPYTTADGRRRARTSASRRTGRSRSRASRSRGLGFHAERVLLDDPGHVDGDAARVRRRRAGGVEESPAIRHHPDAILAVLKLTRQSPSHNTTPPLSATDTSPGDRPASPARRATATSAAPAISGSGGLRRRLVEDAFRAVLVAPPSTSSHRVGAVQWRLHRRRLEAMAPTVFTVFSFSSHEASLT